MKKSSIVLSLLGYVLINTVSYGMQEGENLETQKVISFPKISTQPPSGYFWKQSESGACILQKSILQPKLINQPDNTQHKKVTEASKHTYTSSLHVSSGSTTEEDELLKEFSPTYKPKVVNVLKKVSYRIAVNFFPDVTSGKLTLKEVAQKCETSLEEIAPYYKEYLKK